jgi:hypothetical protein
MGGGVSFFLFLGYLPQFSSYSCFIFVWLMVITFIRPSAATQS